MLEHDEFYEECKKCGGSGRVIVEQDDPYSDDEFECDYCNGWGKLEIT